MTNQMRFALGLTATMLLAACAKSAPDAANAASAANAAVEAPAAPAAAPAVEAAAPAAVGGAPTADYMVGKWSAIEEDCSDTLEFRKDGTLTTPIGDAKWTLVGDKMTMDYGDGSKQPASTLKVVSQERIEVTTGSGKKEFSKRCP